MTALTEKVIITGAAGLVGQNLVQRLVDQGWRNIVCIDKHAKNLEVLRQLAPSVVAIEADLAEPGGWVAHFADAKLVVMNHAQITGLNEDEFKRNNVMATQHVLEALDHQNPPFIVHISSSVVNSQADDIYVRTKTEQESLVHASGLPHCVLRPTLMFGWFDRKHLGWLKRFLEKTPVFPVPDDGAFVRQPLFARDFCDIIAACMTEQPNGAVFDISGLEKVTYIEIIRTIRKVIGARTPIINLPYRMFWTLLWTAGKTLPRPPFTTQQLEALVIPETFPVFDWPARFNVVPTGFEEAVNITFLDSEKSQITLEF